MKQRNCVIDICFEVWYYYFRSKIPGVNNTTFILFIIIFTDIRYIFLVGGFAESSVLQLDIRQEFGHIFKIIIPQDVSLAILKGKNTKVDTIEIGRNKIAI